MAVWPRMAEMYNYVLMIISILEISEDVWQVNNNRIKKKEKTKKRKEKLNKFYHQNCHLKIAELIVANNLIRDVRFHILASSNSCFEPLVHKKLANNN